MVLPESGGLQALQPLARMPMHRRRRECAGSDDCDFVKLHYIMLHDIYALHIGDYSF